MARRGRGQRRCLAGNCLSYLIKLDFRWSKAFITRLPKAFFWFMHFLFPQADLPRLVGGEAPGRVHGQGQLCQPDQHDGKQPRRCRCRRGEGGGKNKLSWDIFRAALFSGEQWLDASTEDKVHRPVQGSKVRCLSLWPKSRVRETEKPFLWKEGGQKLSSIDEYLKLGYEFVMHENETNVTVRVNCTRKEIEARQMKSVWCVSHQLQGETNEFARCYQLKEVHHRQVLQFVYLVLYNTITMLRCASQVECFTLCFLI